MGFRFHSQKTVLKNFLKFVEQRNETYIRNKTVLKWAALASSPSARRNRLLIVRRFAIVMHAENNRNQIPPIDAFGKIINKRRRPYILSDKDLGLLLTNTSQLTPRSKIRSLTYSTLFALLAATGLRVSEAIALNIKDIAKEGLIIRLTKFRKDRLVPIHQTTREALNRYLKYRMKYSSISQSLFISKKGTRMSYSVTNRIFKQLIKSIGLFDDSGHSTVHIHDLRHRFAIRSLEKCHQKDSTEISRHMVALSTYMGHGKISSTYWYLHSTPNLMLKIAKDQEKLYRRKIK